MYKQLKERNSALTNQFNEFQKKQTQQPQRGSFSRNRCPNSIFSRVDNQRNSRGHFCGSNRCFSGPRLSDQRPQWQKRNQSSYTPRQHTYEYFPQQYSNSFFQPQSSSFQPHNRNSNSIFQPRPSFDVFTPDPNYMPYTQKTQKPCHKCGYPNHLGTNCSVTKRLCSSHRLSLLSLLANAAAPVWDLLP